MKHKITKIIIISIIIVLVLGILYTNYTLGNLTQIDFVSNVNMLMNQARYNSSIQYINNDDLVRNNPILYENIEDLKKLSEKNRYGDIIPASAISLKNSEARKLISIFEELVQDSTSTPYGQGYYIVYEEVYYSIFFEFCTPHCGPYR